MTGLAAARRQDNLNNKRTTKKGNMDDLGNLDKNALVNQVEFSRFWLPWWGERPAQHTILGLL